MNLRGNIAILIDKLKDIRMLIMDIDGTLTDGKITIDINGNESKNFNVKDGMGIVLLKNINVIPVFLSGRSSKIVEYRAKELGVHLVYQGIKDKGKVVKQLIDKYNLKKDNIAYVGDDINDICVTNVCGLIFAVADACDEFQNISDYITRKKGGDGAVREIVDLLLRAGEKI